MKKTGSFLTVLMLTITCRASSNTVSVSTNWVVTTNWVKAPAHYRMLNGKLQDASQAPWQSLNIPATPTINRYQAPVSTGLRIEKNQPAGLPPQTKLFTVWSSWRSSRLPSISTQVKNVPLTAQDLNNGAERDGLSRPLNIRAFLISSKTNMNGFKIESIQREYDHGLPYTGNIPIVNRRAVYKTNVVETAAK